MIQVKTGGPYLILAEGLFMYLQEADVNDLFQRIHKELGTSEIVCEFTNLYWVKKMNSSWMKWKFRRQLGILQCNCTVFRKGKWILHL